MGDPLQIANYQVVDVLGRGGMGVVYEAVHENGEAAAVKTVRVATESTLESIRREILMLRELRHPGVVGIRDHGVEGDGTPWYAMDLLHGRTLRDDLRVWFPAPDGPDDSTRDLKKGSGTSDRVEPVAIAPRRAPPRPPPYSLRHVATLFRLICEPLSYVHGQGVIHRDLSPNNIFLVSVNGADRPVLFDFGLAAQFAAAEAREVLEFGGYALGTIHYMAPEQARGEVVDARADIYSLGCILYEALTGRPPFLDEGKRAVLLQHLEDAPKLPSQLVPACAAFDELLLRMLAKRPRDRIGYVDDVALALARIAADEGSTDPLPEPRRSRAYTYRAGFVGRGEIIRDVDAKLGKLAVGRGSCIALLGASGAGKTRLAAEIATRAASVGIRVVAGECDPVAVNESVRAAPLHPLRPLLRAIADRCREGGRLEADRVLGADGHLLAAYEPALAPFVRMSERSSTAVARFRLFSVLREIISSVVSEEPILLVLDDMQWADELTLAFLRFVGQDFFSRARMALALTARVDEMTPELEATMRALDAKRFDVPRLDRDSVGAMVRDMLALDEEAPTLADYVSTRSGGNPLFAAEYLRIAVDQGVVVRDDSGRWKIRPRDDESYDKLPTPGSVQELGRRRLELLGEHARALAVAAAVLGRSCDSAVLTATAAMVADDANAGIAELIQRHVVEDVNGQLRFGHDSLRELAYSTLSTEAQSVLHRRAAIAVEAYHREDADFPLRFAELAYHWERAGDRGLAANYLERAAENALDTAAFGEARTMLAHLLELASDAAAPRRARWLRRLGEASYALGDLQGLAAYSRQALDTLDRALPSSKIRLGARVAAGLAQQLWSRTLRRPPATKVEPAIVEAALASAQLTTHYFFNDDSLGLVHAALSAINLAERGGGDDLPIAEIYAQLGYAAGLARLGGVARGYFSHARAVAHRTKDTNGLIKTLNTEAAFSIGIGAWDEVRKTAAEALTLAREIRNPQDAEDSLTILGHAEFATGNYHGARELAIALRESARSRSNAQHEAWGIYTVARVALYEGDYAAAIADFERAMEMLAHMHDRASRILCGGMQASALAQSGDVARARAAADACVAAIAGKTPPVFSITEGLVGLCDAYLALWKRTQDKAYAAPARAAVAELQKLARLLPIASPPASIRLGLYHQLDGSRRRAIKSLRAGLEGADRLATPHDQRVARAALATLDA
jgi:serine/threonine protein kinase